MKKKSPASRKQEHRDGEWSIILAIFLEFALIAFGDFAHVGWIIQCGVSGIRETIRKLLEDWWERKLKR